MSHKGFKAKKNRQQRKKNSSGRKVNSSKVGCPQARGTLLVVVRWADPKNPAKLPVMNVTLTPSAGSGGGSATDADGYWTSPQLPLSPHRVKIAFAVPGDFGVQDSDEQSATPAQEGEIVLFKLKAGSLKFHIQTGDNIPLPDIVGLRVTGPSPFDGPATGAKASIPTAGRGRYTPTLNLPPGVSDLYAAPVIPEIDLGPGEDRTVPIVLQPRPVPVIDIPAPGILIVRQPYHGQPQPGVRPHRIPVRLSASPTHDGTGEFRYPGYLRAFDGRDDTVPLPSPLPLSTGDLRGRTVYLEASDASPSNRGTPLQLELAGGSIPPRPAVSAPITCVRLKLDVFESGAPTALAADAKLSPGRGVVVGGKRAKVEVSQAVPADFPGKILVRPLAGNFAAYSTEVPDPGDVALLPAALAYPNASLAAPQTFWTGSSTVSRALADEGWIAGVEGVEESGSLVEGDRVALTGITLTLEMFTGAFAAGTVITIAPFYSNDDVATLDAALPDAEHNQPAAGRPAQHDAAFAAPQNTVYDDHVAANGDPKVFRFRVKVAPTIAALAAPALTVKVKVLTAAGGPPTEVSTQMLRRAYNAPGGTASHADGMPLTLQRKQAENLFLSPYLRVLTIAQPGRSKVDAYAIIHSLPPIFSADIAKGYQFGRQLIVSADAPFPVNGAYTLGGVPYADIPVQFYYVSGSAPDVKFAPMPANKIHQLNQYWAGAGLQFHFADPSNPLIHRQPPPSSLVTMGEDTGCAAVSADRFDLSVELTVVAGGHTLPVSVDAMIPANASSRNVADALCNRVRELDFPGGPLAGLQLDADLFDLANPRSEMRYDLNLCRSDTGTGHDMTQMPHRAALPDLGTAGPVDVNFRAASTSPVAVTSIKVTKIEAFHGVSGAALAVGPGGLDLKAPNMTAADHSVIRNPPQVVTRHWVRHLAPNGATHVSVAFEGVDCFDPNDNGSRTLLNPGIWNEPNARLFCYMRDTCLAIGPDDVQHEMGHALATLNHTMFHPKWFYNAELLRNGSGEPSNKTTRMTSQKMFVDGIERFGGGWYAAYIALPQGYGGAARAGAAAINGAWLSGGPAPGQLPW